jgi:hypothetical protein
MHIEEIERRLDQERERLGAGSCTLYVRDAYWQGEYRLVCMPGVKIREPMYGLVSPAPTKRMICEGETEVFLSNADLIGARCATPHVSSGVHENDRLLFCDFGEREGVKALARLFDLGTDGKPDVVFFCQLR